MIPDRAWRIAVAALSFLITTPCFSQYAPPSPAPAGQGKVFCSRRENVLAMLSKPPQARGPAAAYGCYPMAASTSVMVLQTFPPLPTGAIIWHVQINGVAEGYPAYEPPPQRKAAAALAPPKPGRPAITAIAPPTPPPLAAEVPKPSPEPPALASLSPTAQPAQPTPRDITAAVPPSGARAPTSRKPFQSSTTKQDSVLRITDAQISARLVRESRAEYYATGHPCACPDDVARNGSRCGGRSAYSRPGGAEPYCYVADVPASEIEAYRQRLQ
jgi:hypothetical protein